MNINMDKVFNNYIKPKVTILSHQKSMQGYLINAHRAKITTVKIICFLDQSNVFLS